MGSKEEHLKFQTVDAGSSDNMRNLNYIHETSLAQPSESLQASELNQSTAKDRLSTLPAQTRAKWEICENLRMLSVLESQEQIKRKSLDNYINLYANIQAKKQRSTSPGQKRFQTKFSKESISMKIREYSELKKVKTQLSDKMKSEYGQYTAEMRRNHVNSRDPTTYQHADPVTRMLQVVTQYRQRRERQEIDNVQASLIFSDDNNDHFKSRSINEEAEIAPISQLDLDSGKGGPSRRNTAGGKSVMEHARSP